MLESSIWKVDDLPKKLKKSSIDSEGLLENLIKNDMSILNDKWLPIGSQVITDFGKKLDILAIAPDGSLIVIELKKSKTTREVVTQAIDYAAYIERLNYEDINKIFVEFSGNESLLSAVKGKLGVELSESDINNTHQIVIVAEEIDDYTDRIINYLSKRDININLLYFQIYTDDINKFLLRHWIVDPSEIQINDNTNKVPWNGEFYGCFGETEGSRNWDDARRYGFISAGGGNWYTGTLRRLVKGDRV